MKFVASTIASFLVAGSAFAGGYVAPVVDVAPVVVETVTPVDVSWTGFYAGLQYGQGSAEADAAGVSVDEDFDAYGLHAGYLHDFGKYVLGGELDYNKIDADNIDEDGDLLRLRARAGYDLGRFMPYVTLGAANLEMGDVSETAFTYGLGAEFKATEKFSFGAEYTKQDFEDVESTGVDLDTDLLQVRASYHF